MADFITANNALRDYLIANFTALPLFWPNDSRDPSENGGINGFAYSESRMLDERPVTLGLDGSRRHRDLGELSVIVYVPSGTFAGAAEAHAATIKALFKPNCVADIQITSRRIGLGERAQGGRGHWWAVPIIIHWFSDRTE